MIKGLFGSINDPRDEKDEVEHYCKNCGMEEVEEKGSICDECFIELETIDEYVKKHFCECGKFKKKNGYELCKVCLL